LDNSVVTSDFSDFFGTYFMMELKSKILFPTINAKHNPVGVHFFINNYRYYYLTMGAVSINNALSLKDIGICIQTVRQVASFCNLIINF
jgi:hypothetical protein